MISSSILPEAETETEGQMFDQLGMSDYFLHFYALCVFIVSKSIQSLWTKKVIYT